MVRWICGVSLEDRRRSVDSMGVESVADVVRRGRIIWFGHLEHWGLDDWNLDVGLYSNVVVAGVRCADS